MLCVTCVDRGVVAPQSSCATSFGGARLWQHGLLRLPLLQRGAFYFDSSMSSFVLPAAKKAKSASVPDSAGKQATEVLREPGATADRKHAASSSQAGGSEGLGGEADGQAGPLGVLEEGRTSAPHLDYTPPSWSARSQAEWFFEVIKGGVIVEEKRVPFDAPFVVCGRLPTCHISMDHDSISRMHAVLQFDRGGAVHIYDLGSVHGTFVNKSRIPPRAFVPLPIGSLLRFGESSRLYILQNGALRGTTGQLDEVENERAGGEGPGDYVGETLPPDELGGRSEDRDNRPAEDFVQVLRRWLEEHEARLFFERVARDGKSVADAAALAGGGDANDIVLRVTIPSSVCSDGEAEYVFEGSGSSRRAAELSVCKAACDQLMALGHMAVDRGEDEWKEWKRRRREDQEDENDRYYDRTLKTGSTESFLERMHAESSPQALLSRRRLVEAKALEARQQVEDLAVRIGDSSAQGMAAPSEDLDELDSFMEAVGHERDVESMAALKKDLAEYDAELALINTMLPAGPAHLPGAAEVEEGPSLSLPKKDGPYQGEAGRSEARPTPALYPPPPQYNNEEIAKGKVLPVVEEFYEYSSNAECMSQSASEAALRLKAKYGY